MNFKTKPGIIITFIILIIFGLAGCMKDDQWVRDHLQQGPFKLSSSGVFVVNEGNFMYGNATLSFYDPLAKQVENDLFYRANGLPLGDVAQSMTIRKSSGYVVINNSGKIYVLDINTGKYSGKITGFTSPRYMHFVNDEKAYVTDLYAGKITIVNPSTGQITSYIPCPVHASTEEMVQSGNRLFVTCWSGDRTVLVVDTSTDQVISEIRTGEQPCGIVLDKYNKIWVLCQALPGNGSTIYAVLQRIDPVTLKIEKSYNFPADTKPVKLCMDGFGENLYFLAGNTVRKMAVTSDALPVKSFITLTSKILYGLGIDPVNGDVYVSDALDYQQSGFITRFDSLGNVMDTFRGGIIPGRFCFKISSQN